MKGGLILSVDLWHRQLVFGSQCFCQRLFHHPFQGGKTVQIVGELVVLHQSPVLGLEELNDGEITIIDEFGSVQHFSALLLVSLTLVFNDFFWHPQSNASIEGPSISSISVRIFLEDMNVIVEKPRCFRSCMGDQGFGLREFQLEFLLQERSQALLDFLCFLLWANNYV